MPLPLEGEFMGEAVERLVALAGKVHVGAYERVTSTGKTVHVDAYTRSPGDMADGELFKEFKELSTSKGKEASGLNPQAAENRRGQVLNEIRKRESAGTWHPDAAPNIGSAGAPEPVETPPASPKKPPVKKAAGGGKEAEGHNLSDEEVDKGANDAADRILASTAEAETTVSPVLKSVVDSVGGSFFGWDHRVKQKDSLVRKLKDRINNKNKDAADPVAKSEAGIGDSLRYTAISDGDNNIEMANQIVAQLESQGHTVVEQDNAWGHGGAYYGINMNFKAPNGLTWELQIHTPESMERKDTSHFWYDFSRDSTLPQDVRDDAARRASDSWVGLSRPKDWDTFGTLRPKELRTGDKAVRQSEGKTMPKTSVPPKGGPEAKEGDVTTWGGYKFKKTAEGWAYLGPA